MAKTSPLLIAAFPAMKQKGRKAEKKIGEKSKSATHQQHGETAYSAEPEKLSTSKPKQMEHSKKKMAPPYSLGAKSSNNVSPREAVEHDAHYAKVSATRDWVAGRVSTKEHDAVHRRANAVLKHHGRRP